MQLYNYIAPAFAFLIFETGHLCYVFEHATEPGGSIPLELNSNPNCAKSTKIYASNPSIHFASPDLTMTREFTTSQVTMMQPVPLLRNDVFVLKTISDGACSGSSVHKGSNIFMKIGATYYRLDPRLKLITNTMVR